MNIWFALKRDDAVGCYDLRENELLGDMIGAYAGDTLNVLRYAKIETPFTLYEASVDDSKVANCVRCAMVGDGMHELTVNIISRLHVSSDSDE